MTAEYDEFLEAGRERWRQAIRSHFGDNPPSRAEWSDISRMPEVLTPFMGESVNHTYLPTGGGQAMTSAALGTKRGTLELGLGRASYILKPEKLAFHYFPEAAAQSFLYLTGGRLKQTDVYDFPVDDVEELVETGPGDYHPRGVWDQGYLGHNENGDEIPLPDDARLALRFLRGNFMIVGNGSFWNGNSRTYDGEHDKLGEEQVRALILAAIDRHGLAE